jgi:peptidoglycan/xylan/chitin deacetylase (PgdA/CDA1 family)
VPRRLPDFLAVLALALLPALAPGCADASPAPEPAAPPAHPVTVSLEFDDGDTQAPVPDLLARRRFPATFFINSALVGRPGHFGWRDLRALAAAGHEIAGHTRTHPDLTTLGASAQKREICDDRATLVAHGLRPVNFAYPYGRYTAQTKRIVRACGYASARRASGLRAPDRPAVNRRRLTDLYAIPTLPAPQDTTPAQDIIQAVTAAEQHGGGWVQVFWHRICPDDCGRFSWPAERLDEVLGWLRGEVDAGRVRIATVRDALRPVTAR